MRLSIIRSGLVAIGAAAAMAACSGHGIVPSQSFAAPSNVAPLAAKPTPTPNCYTAKYQPEWIFKGSCLIGKLTSKGLAMKLKAYKGTTLDVTLPPNNAVGTVPFVLVDALNKSGDIASYKGHAFPAYDNNKDVVIYAEGVNLGKKPVEVKNSVTMVITLATGMKFPGKSCGLAYLTKSLKWSALPIVSSPKGQTLKLLVSSALVNRVGGFPTYPAALFFSVFCSKATM